MHLDFFQTTKHQIERRFLSVAQMSEVDPPGFTVTFHLWLQFRLVAVSDFAKKMTWPELVPALKTAIHNSDLMNGTGNSELKTLNVLISLQTVIKPFQVCYCTFITVQAIVTSHVF